MPEPVYRIPAIHVAHQQNTIGFHLFEPLTATVFQKNAHPRKGRIKTSTQNARFDALTLDSCKAQGV